MCQLKTSVRLPIDITLRGTYCGKDPFYGEITGVFTDENGRVMTVPGFYRGDGQWSVRFSSETEGDWRYAISSDTVALEGDTEGVLRVSGETAGATRQLHTKGTHFVTSDGKGVFLLGYECNFLFSLLASPDGARKLDTLLDNIQEAGFNQVQINTYARDYSFRQGRTRENDFGPVYIDLWEETADGRRFNPAFFDNYDQLIRTLHLRGIYAQIYLKVYNKYVAWPENDSPEDMTFYRLFVARYQAYPNVVWNISKEGYFEPDKEYFYRVLRHVRAWDAYQHLCTVHDDLQYALDERYAHTIDFLTLQQHFEWQYAHAYYRALTGKPVVGGETGVESPRVERVRRYPAERVCAIAYEIIMSGGYYQYYWAYTAWDVIEYAEKPKGYAYMRRMRDFFSAFDLTAFKPKMHACVWSGLCLDDEESTMLVYVEPREHIPQYVNREGIAYSNLVEKGTIESCEAFGVYDGRREQVNLTRDYVYQPDKARGFNGKTNDHLILFRSFPEQPTVFVIRYRK